MLGVEKLAPKRFEIVGRLGEGGMGIVYEAIDRQHGDRVALKTLRTQSVGGLERFKREFRALQDIHHKNLVSLGELFTEDDTWFFTMELVEGEDVLSYVRGAGRAGNARSATTSRRTMTYTPSSDGAATTMSGADLVRSVRQQRAWTRSRGGLDEARLRSVIVQLAQALNALHGVGLVHRDVKPSNVRVTAEGRLVLLDFGIIAQIGSSLDTADGGIGTAAYMAPEQALVGAVGPGADWYSMGVVLYEMLTGELPFNGSSAFMLAQKQWQEPDRPSVLVAGTPADLDDLCMALLSFDPTARPVARDIERTIGVAPSGDSSERAHSSSRAHGPGFVGRATELAVLRDAFDDVAGQGATRVLVEGESGVGKTCLVRHFIDETLREVPDTAVLSGRCYERESVPFTAFDGVVESLALLLMPLLDEEVVPLLPRRIAPLVQVFPVLRRVESIARLIGGTPGATDPAELRARAFVALRELLLRVGERQPLIIELDDIQWADDDSRALLTEVMRPPDAPDLLLILTRRTSESAGPDAFVPSLGGAPHHLELPRLADGEAAELASKLLARAGQEGSADEALEIAREAKGHPLFIDLLVRHGAGDTRRGVSLEDALVSRLDQLDELARRAIDLLAVAGAPIPSEVLARAAAGGAELTRRLALLRIEHLVQTKRTERGEMLDVYHDRIRVTLLARFTADRRTTLHLRLAIALETTGAGDPEMLATNWRGAGNVERAFHYTVEAADRATNALAFDHAARLYDVALATPGRSPDVVRELHAKHGDALANAGRGALAAGELLLAAVGAPVADALDRRRRAAEQLLRAGHFDRGLETIRAVLASIGMQLPATPFLALLIFLWGRFVVFVRGLGFHEQDVTQVAGRDLARIDMYWSVTSGLALIDTTRAAAFQTRHLLLALRAGEPFRVSRALSLEIAFRGRAGGKRWPETEALMANAEALAARTGRQEAVGLVMMSCGLAHYYGGFNLRKSVELLDRAAEVLADCGGVAWEFATAQMFALSAIAFLGEMNELDQRREKHLRAAVERGDLYFQVNLRIGHPHMVWLAKDKPHDGLLDLDDAMRRWSKQGFHIEHFTAMVAHVNTDLYLGRGADAYESARSQWDGLRGSLLLTVQSIRTVGFYTRGRGALGGAAASRSERRALLEVASRDARALAKEAWRWSIPLAASLEAGVAKLGGGDDERALRKLGEAARGFENLEMNLHAAAARRQRGRLLGGDEGATLVTGADAWMRTHGVHNPERMAATLVPGFDG